VQGEGRLTGVEIEMESSRYSSHNIDDLLRNIPNCNWRVAAEGSLRNDGFEVVFTDPLPLEQALTTLSQAYPMFEGATDTFRAAVHTHLNVQDLSREEYLRAVLGYVIMEPYIFGTVGKGRDESIFCVPWSKSNSHIKRLINAYTNECPDAWDEAITHSPKYSACNMQATAVFGSLEFRHLQTPVSTPLDSITEIADYVTLCHGILEYATSDRHRDSLMQYADWCIGRLPSRYQALEHLASVYGLLAPTAAVDVLADGLSTPTVHHHLRARPSYMNMPRHAPATRRRITPTWTDDLSLMGEL
jgi:hypothetical protein